MNRILSGTTVLMLLCGTLLFSCKKSSEDDTKPLVAEAKYSSKDPVAFSTATSVWHGQHVTGKLPSLATSATLKLESPSENVVAIKGQLVILKPVINEGDVAGYYLSINGANEYFKVDFTKARSLAKSRAIQNNRISNASVHSSFGQAKTRERGPLGIGLAGGDDNFNDSTIVINLPSDIKTPDTICVTYWAYDYNNHISNPVNVCLYVNHLGNDGDNNWMTGTWIPTRYEEIVDNKIISKDTMIYNQWIPDNYDNSKLWNHNDSLFTQSIYDDIPLNHDSISYSGVDSSGYWFFYYALLSGQDKFLGYASYYYYTKNAITFNTAGSYTVDNVSSNKYINYDSSTVKNLVYRMGHDNYFEKGSWSFNSSTNKMIIISIDNEKDYDDYMIELTFTKISDKIVDFQFSELDEYDNKVHTYRSRIERQ